jgi:hypothetical protein
MLLTLMAALAAVWTASCASHVEEHSGKVELALSGVSASGKTYRLRNGTIRITGTSTASVSTEDNVDAPSINLELKAGGYLARLVDGWFLERGKLDPMTGTLTFENVKAVLTSVNPAPFTVEDQRTTNLRFRFNAGDDVVQLGNGKVDIGIDVNDCTGGPQGCDHDGDGFPAGMDCNDNDPNVFPGAPETCGDMRDNNCDGRIDENCGGCMPGNPNCDADGDGFPAGMDCDDNDPSTFPGAMEQCDGRDNNCNGIADEGCSGCMAGDPACDADADGVPAGMDCNDQDPQTFPGAPELCDMRDNNCDGMVDENCGSGTCSVVTQTGCPTGLACYFVNQTGATTCLPPGNVPRDAPCTGMALNECAPPAVCTSPNGVNPRCFGICDPADPMGCSPPQHCLASPLPGIGVCF